jgi:hypothetical protein
MSEWVERDILISRLSLASMVASSVNEPPNELVLRRHGVRFTGFHGGFDLSDISIAPVAASSLASLSQMFFCRGSWPIRGGYLIQIFVRQRSTPRPSMSAKGGDADIGTRLCEASSVQPARGSMNWSTLAIVALVTLVAAGLLIALVEKWSLLAPALSRWSWVVEGH